MTGKGLPKREVNISSLWKREAGRDFQSAKVLRDFKLQRLFGPERD
jgi:hypothetical protein